MTNIIDQARELMARKHMKQPGELAELLGVNVRTVRKWLRREAAPRSYNAAAIRARLIVMNRNRDQKRKTRA